MSHRVKQVEAIAHGTVIDHIPPAATLRVVRLLAMPGDQVFIGINLRSAKMGAKGVVKIAERELDPDSLSRVALTAPGATMCIIRDYLVVQKGPIPAPTVLHDLGPCPNPNCVTNHERGATHFTRLPDGLWRCRYCERHFPADELAAASESPGPRPAQSLTARFTRPQTAR